MLQSVSFDSGDSRPRFEVVVRQTDFRHLGVDGELRLTFFNDRLYGIAFYPRLADHYLRQLGVSGLRLPRSSEPLELSRNSLVWSGSDETGVRYVAWIDRRLLDEMERWLTCYSAEEAPARILQP